LREGLNIALIKYKSATPMKLKEIENACYKKIKNIIFSISFRRGGEIEGALNYGKRLT
jgi:hypothetical protein